MRFDLGTSTDNVLIIDNDLDLPRGDYHSFRIVRVLLTPADMCNITSKRDRPGHVVDATRETTFVEPRHVTVIVNILRSHECHSCVTYTLVCVIKSNRE